MRRAIAAACMIVTGCASAEEYRVEQAAMEQRLRACRADRSDRCSDVGSWLVRQFRYDEARAVFHRSCGRGDYAACVNASEQFGEPTLLDACRISVEACFDAALSPTTAAPDRDLAIGKFCEATSRCSELFERLLRRGVDVAARARALCTPPGLPPKACGELGLLSWPDRAIGVELLGRSCSNGDARACWQHARRTPDPSVAQRSAQRACQLGYHEACDLDAAGQALDQLRAQCRDAVAAACEQLGQRLSAP